MHFGLIIIGRQKLGQNIPQADIDRHIELLQAKCQRKLVEREIAQRFLAILALTLGNRRAYGIHLEVELERPLVHSTLL